MEHTFAIKLESQKFSFVFISMKIQYLRVTQNFIAAKRPFIEVVTWR